MSYRDKARDVLSLEIQGLQKVREHLDKSFDDAIVMLLDALSRGGKIVVCGIGKNLHVGEKIAATLTSTGATSVPMNPIQAMHGDLGILSRFDVVLMLSYSGETEEMLSVLPSIRRLGAKVITLTGSPESTLARESDVVITVAIDKEACPFNMAPTASTTATLAVGDAIAMTLLDARGFKREDYARLHPGGAIGRSLLLRVSDIMRTGDRVPSVRGNDSVKDALLAMTRARSGSAAVVDDELHVVGIFTDGDLRRNIAVKDNLLNMSVSEVMTRSPITVLADELAVDVLMVYEKHKIDDLIVVDKDHKLVGAVDIQDLPGLKVL